MYYLFIYNFYSNKNSNSNVTLFSIFCFFLSFVSNNNSNPNVILFSIFFFYVLSQKYIFCFYNYLNLVWLNFWTFSLFNKKKKPTYKKRSAQIVGNLNDFSFFN